MYLILLTIGIFGAQSLASANNQYGIIGGRNATKGEFPYQISIQLCFGGVSCGQQCGGAILNEQWIITAAHCYLGMDFEEYKVYAGLINLKDPNKQVSEVGKWFIHPDYISDTLVSDHDIALIKLSTPLELNDLVQPIKLPESDLDEPEGTATISGWGATFYNGTYATYPDDLSTIDVPIIDYDSCMEIIKQQAIEYDLKYNHSVVCTGPRTGGIGACHGDSGGPLVQNGVVIGLADWTTSDNSCADVGSLVVFTKVSSYLSWINDVINNN